MLVEILKRLKRIDELIQIKASGGSADLAKRLNVSERTVLETIRLMKELGAPIKYDRGRRSYYYEFEGQFKLGFEPLEISVPEMNLVPKPIKENGESIGEFNECDGNIG